MSAEIKPSSFRIDDSRKQKIDEIILALAPFVKSRSHVVNLAIDCLHVFVFMRQTVHGAFERLQGLLRTTSYSQLPGIPVVSADEPPDTSGARGLEESPRLRVLSPISRSTILHYAVGLGMVAWLPPFSRVCAKGGVA